MASESVAGWLLLEDPFSNQVYIARDFRIVEQLFDCLADGLPRYPLDLRRQLSATGRRSRVLGERCEEPERKVGSLHKDN